MGNQSDVAEKDFRQGRSALGSVPPGLYDGGRGGLQDLRGASLGHSGVFVDHGGRHLGAFEQRLLCLGREAQANSREYECYFFHKCLLFQRNIVDFKGRCPGIFTSFIDGGYVCS